MQVAFSFGFVGACIGSASALLLVSLEWATQYREHHLWIIALLPVAGLLIGLMYHYWAGTASRGNNYLIEEIRSPHDIIPFRMAPLVYIGTVLTHLFGGSAGREGTGVQMGGAIADQFSCLFRMRRRDHRLMVAIGISAGFASVFGTPLAGAVFGLEVIVVGRMRYEAILPSFLSAAVASMVCHAWGVEHTHYVVSEVPFPDASNLLWTRWCRYSVRTGCHVVFTFHRFLVRNGQAHQLSPFPSADRRTGDCCSCLDDRNDEIYRFGCTYHCGFVLGAADVV